MKILHLSDLHLGKRVNEFSMIEDQDYILKEILKIIDQEQIETIIIAGDIYDKPVPPAEAVELFDDFLVQLSSRRLHVFVISGNHDSAERIAFGGRLMDQSGIHVSPVYNGSIVPIKLNDAYGDISFYMLPFIKPVHVRRYYPETLIETYTDAMRVVIQNMHVNASKRNILISHQFVTGSLRSDSEDITVGGTDNVDSSVFEEFDYVALGHIHRAQKCGREFIRYCGTPLKYSFSEANDHKTVTIVDFQEKGNIKLSYVPLTPKRDLVEIKGTYNEIIQKSFYENTNYPEDYVHITLTDEEDIPEVMSKLRVVYKNVMKLDYDNSRTRSDCEVQGADTQNKKTPMEYFEDFYELQNGMEMIEEQKKYMSHLIEEIWEGKR